MKYRVSEIISLKTVHKFLSIIGYFAAYEVEANILPQVGKKQSHGLIFIARREL
jgi:hypothetical protein